MILPGVAYNHLPSGLTDKTLVFK